MSNASDQLDKAIDGATNWAVTGWTVTFGNRNVEVNSLKEAEALKDSFPNHLEALSYWQDVNTIGQETTVLGNKAKDALSNGDLGAAKNAIYLARYMEKRINSATPTWGPAYQALEESS